MFNLGSGKGYSVLELINAFKDISAVDVPYKFAPRRAGDLPEFYAEPSKALQLMGWKTELDLNQMLADTWHWQKNNPKGYQQ